MFGCFAVRRCFHVVAKLDIPGESDTIELNFFGISAIVRSRGFVGWSFPMKLASEHKNNMPIIVELK